MKVFSIFGIIISTLGLLIAGYMGYKMNDFYRAVNYLDYDNKIDKKAYYEIESLKDEHLFLFTDIIPITIAMFFSFFLIYSIYINLKYKQQN